MARLDDTRAKVINVLAGVPTDLVDLEAVILAGDTAIEALADAYPGLPVEDLPFDETWRRAVWAELLASALGPSLPATPPGLPPAPPALRLNGIVNRAMATRVARFLDALPTTSTLELQIDSPGGSVFDAFAIATAVARIRATGCRVVAHVTRADSAASFIASVADEVVIRPAGRMMIHDCHSTYGGRADEHAAEAEVLDHLSTVIAEQYHRRTRQGTPATWREAMREETTYTAAEAVTAGLADRVG